MTDRTGSRVAVLISGNGSNLQAILDACADGTIANARVVGVVSNRRKAYGLVRAEKAGVEQVYFPLGPFRKAHPGTDRAAYDVALAERVAALSPDLIVLAGWMHILSADFLDAVPCPVLNLHPALPGAFPGTGAIARAFEAARAGKLTHTGVMVHHVIPEIDAGPVVATAEVPIHADDDLEALTARMHAVEHTLLVQAVDLVLNPPQVA